MSWRHAAAQTACARSWQGSGRSTHASCCRWAAVPSKWLRDTSCDSAESWDMTASSPPQCRVTQSRPTCSGCCPSALPVMSPTAVAPCRVGPPARGPGAAVSRVRRPGSDCRRTLSGGSILLLTVRSTADHRSCLPLTGAWLGVCRWARCKGICSARSRHEGRQSSVPLQQRGQPGQPSKSWQSCGPPLAKSPTYSPPGMGRGAQLMASALLQTPTATNPGWKWGWLLET